LGENLIQVFFQLALILSDLKNSKTCVVSLRSGAFFFSVGMSIILIFLGLFSVWLILFLVISGYLQMRLFFQGLHMRDDS